MNLAEIERTMMSETVIEKTWEVPARSGKGPVTITLRLPEVTITDSEGRYIVISPEQAEIVSSKMEGIAIGWRMPLSSTAARRADELATQAMANAADWRGKHRCREEQYRDRRAG